MLTRRPSDFSACCTPRAPAKGLAPTPRAVPAIQGYLIGFSLFHTHLLYEEMELGLIYIRVPRKRHEFAFYLRAELIDGSLQTGPREPLFSVWVGPQNC